MYTVGRWLKSHTITLKILKIRLFSNWCLCKIICGDILPGYTLDWKVSVYCHFFNAYMVHIGFNLQHIRTNKQCEHMQYASLPHGYKTFYMLNSAAWKFQLLIKTKMLKNKLFLFSNSHVFYHANKF